MWYFVYVRVTNRTNQLVVKIHVQCTIFSITMHVLDMWNCIAAKSGQANKIDSRDATAAPGVAAPHVMQPNWRSCFSSTHYDLHLLMCDAEKST